MRFKGYRIILNVESSSPLYEFTGRMTKTLIYALRPELGLTRGIKGVLSPLHISPLFHVKGDHDLGEPAFPIVERRRNERPEISPLELNGEYVFHMGGDEKLVDAIISTLSQLEGPLLVKFEDSVIKYKIEKIVDITGEVLEKSESVDNRVRVYLKSPAQIFNVFTPTRLPKFTPSAVELLMVPYALANNIYTITSEALIGASRVLGSLVETWYSLRTLHAVEVLFKGERQTMLGGYVTYLVQPGNGRILDSIRRVLAAAELVGVGRSRTNGFGTTIIR